MSTARTIIRLALLEIGALTKTEQPAADEANDGLTALNAMLGTWSNFAANVFYRTRETFNLGSAASYSIGSGQTFDTVRPLQIVEAFTSSGSIDYPLIIINQEQYDAITFKTASGIPEYLTYNSNYPYGQITFYPVPSGVQSVTLLSEKPITQIASLDTDISFPDGWERAIIKNLAIDLAPQYAQEPSAATVKAAQESLGAIKVATVRSRPIPAFPQSRSIGNIYNGWSS